MESSGQMLPKSNRKVTDVAWDARHGPGGDLVTPIAYIAAGAVCAVSPVLAPLFVAYGALGAMGAASASRKFGPWSPAPVYTQPWRARTPIAEKEQPLAEYIGAHHVALGGIAALAGGMTFRSSFATPVPRLVGTVLLGLSAGAGGVVYLQSRGWRSVTWIASDGVHEAWICNQK